MTMKYRNTITTVALLSIGTLIYGIDVPVGELRAKPTPLEIAAFWTPERRRSVFSRDVAIDINAGAAFIRQADGTMAPVNFNSTSSATDADPTSSPSGQPTKNPTSLPTLSPSKKPTASPATLNPTSTPSKKPTESPTKKPTTSPMLSPTSFPTPNVRLKGNGIAVPSDTDESETLSALSWSDIESDDHAGWTHSDGNLHEGNRQLQDEVSNGDVESPTPLELQAVGRLYFCFDGVGCFVCSATVLTGNILGTAGHCVYNVESDLGFANFVMFVPNQDDGGDDGSDGDCENDLYGCWFPDHGITTSGWASSGIPDGLDDDFGVMVIKTGNGDSHLSVDGFDDAPLDEFVCPFTLDFNQEAFVQSSEFGTAYGYPLQNDPGFRFCQGGVVERNFGPFIALWMEICTMTGGSSGGPWVPYPITDIYSVVSFSFTNGSPGQGGTRCYVDGRCQCVLDATQTSSGNLIVSDVSCPLTRLESSGPTCTSESASPTRKPTNFPTAQPTNKPTTSSPSKVPTIFSESSKPTHYPTKAPSGGSSRSSSSSKASKSSKSKKSCSSISKEKKCKKECQWADDECVQKTINCDEFVTKKKCKKYYPTCEWDLEGNVCTNTSTTGVSANETVAVSPLTGKVVGHDDGLVTMITHNSGCTVANAPAFLGLPSALFALMWYS